VFEMVQRGTWTLVDAAEHLAMSYRQCRRSYQRYRHEGDAGLVHKSRGRRSNRQTDPATRAAILERYEETYAGFGPTLAAEKLGAEGYAIHHETLRRWLVAEGLWARQRRRSVHRQRRERRERFGELVQMDGSFHHWYGADHPQHCLIEMIDDATGIRLCLLAEEETTEACMRLLWQWIERYGVPMALYTDRKNVFVTERVATVEEQLAGEEPRTAFGLACAKLGIAIIPANSPQAKGRVERAHGVMQDRLVKEFQLRGVTTIAGANAVLDGGFVEHLNEKFAVAPANEQNAHRAVPAGVRLAEVFCFEERRVVANDWVVRYHHRAFQISKEHGGVVRARDTVTIRERLDGTVQIVHGDAPLSCQELPSGKVTQGCDRTRDAVRAATVRVAHPPAADHPWRRGLISRRMEKTAGQHP
jgi:transposase